MTTTILLARRSARAFAATLAIVALAALVSGCGIAYESKKNSMLKSGTDADYGPPPPTNYQAFERQLILQSLRDPDSAKIEFRSEPQRGVVPKTMATPQFAWVSRVSVNAKNGYGGYVGFQDYGFAWKDGKIVAVFTPDNGFWINREMTPPTGQ